MDENFAGFYFYRHVPATKYNQQGGSFAGVFTYVPLEWRSPSQNGLLAA